MKAVIEERCAHLLKELRRKKGYTLEEFEAFSGGTVKAVVLGSYERGTRAISLARLEQLAGLYDVPIEYFFVDREVEADMSKGRYVFDLRRIRVLENLDETLEPIKKFLAAVAHKRSDWNGEVMSLRRTDAETLALLSDLHINELNQTLRLSGFLFASEVSGQHSL
ncbi:MAG: helix-turn-helix domain-containing protein [Candidatus Planktophila sp.]